MSLSRRRFGLGAVAFVTALLSTTAQTRVGEPLIRICLDSLDANYSTVTAALTIRMTQDAAHDSNIKVITAVDPILRTGDLAPIDRANRGEGVFKDEYFTWQSFQDRGVPLIGGGPYTGQTWYIRPRATYAKSTGARTRITSYGDGSGLTYGDALAGPKGFQDKSASFSGPCQFYFCGEHILGDKDIADGDGGVTGFGTISINDSGTDANVRTKVRFDCDEVQHNDAFFDRGVQYGGLMLNNLSWSNDIVKMPYTESVALVAGDKTLTITMDTDGDTGTILDFDDSHIWIATDGTAGNSFDNSPTVNGAFTITGGTGGGSQSGAATAETELYSYASRPASEGGGAWLYDPGSAFGNAVDKHGYRKFIGLEGHATKEFSLTVNNADGGIELSKQSTLTATSANEGSVYQAGGTGDPVVVHLPSGGDPTDRIMVPGFGMRFEFDPNMRHVEVIGWRARCTTSSNTGINNRVVPKENFRVSDYSFKFHDGSAAFRIDLGDATILSGGDRLNMEWYDGYIGRAGAGVYPARGEVVSDIATIDGFTVKRLVCEQLGGNDEDNVDAHPVATQGNAIDIDWEQVIARGTGAIIPYQFGEWVTFPTHHQWGSVRMSQIDCDGTATGWSNAGSNSSDAGIMLSGDNDDEASIGNSGATPPTDKQDVSDVVIEYVRVRNHFHGIRDKWRDFATQFTDVDLDDCTNGFTQAGADTASTPDRAPRSALDTVRFGSGLTKMTNLEAGAATDYSISFTNCTAVTTAIETKFSSSEFGSAQTFAQFTANTRTGSDFTGIVREDP